MLNKKKLVKILMERDGMTKEEAIDLIEETKQECLETQSDEPIMDMLGLEPDYLFAVLGF